ncbi:MAG: hypothetical protein ACRDOA_07165 [Streptosporangiaceae bacterium]
MADDGVKRTHQSSEATFREYGCRIDRDLLDRIVALAKKDFPSDASVDISTERKSGAITSKISAESVEQLLDGLRESTAAGDPNWIDNLQIRVSGFFSADSERSWVLISIDPEFSSVRVEGPDAGWVRGRIGELHDQFEYSKVRWTISPALHSVLIGAGLALYVILTSSLIVLEISHFRFVYTVVLWSLIALYIVSFFASRRLTKRRKNRITILPDLSPDRKDWMAISTLVATIFILIATVVGVVYSIVQ